MDEITTDENFEENIENKENSNNADKEIGSEYNNINKIVQQDFNENLEDNCVSLNENEILSKSNDENKYDNIFQEGNLTDSESEQTKENNEKTTEHQNSKTKSLLENLKELVDNSSNEDSSDSTSEKDEPTATNNIEQKPAKIKKLSTEEAEIQRREIKSKTQKLLRENQINIPYYEPKRFTFHEFMSRKALNLKKQNYLKNPSIKMSEEDLEIYSKFLEKRAEEVEKFFKKGLEENENDSNLENMEEHSIPFNEKENCSNTEEHTTQSPKVEIPTSNKLLISEIPEKVYLKSDLDSFTDLVFEKCLKPSGKDILMRGCLKTVKKKVPPKKFINILSTENGKVELINSKINVEENEEFIESKPGAAHLKLKENLKQLIKQKRKMEILKKLKENDELNEKSKSTGSVCSSGDDEYSDCDEYDKNGKKINEDEENFEDDNYSEENHGNKEVDDDDEFDADDDCEADDEDESYDDSKNDENRVIDNEEEEDEKTIKLAENDEENENYEGLLDDLKLSPLKPNRTENSISQVPTKLLSQNVDENELMDLCSGRFTNNFKDELLPSINSHNNMLKSLEGDDDDEEEDFILKPKYKKKKRIYISDDEVENSEKEENNKDNLNEEELSKSLSENEKNGESEESDEENIENVAETYIDYDSEENEIEVKIANKAEEFLEKEAELSESEWGSADEDEKDLDKYDNELGDEDEFNQTELRRELEKIHMRKILDQDIRDVKKIQEMFFDDEENDGIGRQKQFKWNNLNKKFTLGDDNDSTIQNSEENEENNENDNNEELWRKMRYERQLLLKEQNIDRNILEKSNTELNNINLKSVEKKISIIKSSDNKTQPLNNSESEVKSPFLISKLELSSVRGSFLIRDDETLSKLSTSMKLNIDKDEDENISNVKVIKRNNFVFSTISKETNDNDKPINKKIKKISKRKLSENDDSERKNIKKGRLLINQLC